MTIHAFPFAMSELAASLSSAVLWGALAISLVPLLVVAVDVCAALLHRHRAAEPEPVPGRWPRTVVLVPAHNEAGLLGATLNSIAADLPPNTRVLCVAHNCTDDTAFIAAAAGVGVLEARDDGSRGKPGALVAGLEALDADPPDILVIVDADCELKRGALRALIGRVHATGKPAMGSYWFSAGDSGARGRLSSLATRLKNHIRPLGLHVLGLPCVLSGSGSAYPFAAIRQAPHGEGSIAEDYQLTIDLFERGMPTSFVPAALIEGKLPARQQTALKQRRRWEHGHLMLVFGSMPRLFLDGLRRLDRDRMAIALEIGVPPLAALALFCAAIDLAAGLHFVAFGDAVPIFVALAAQGAFALLVLAALARFAGPRTVLLAIGAVPGYLLWKLPLYFAFARRPEVAWRKTDRD